MLFKLILAWGRIAVRMAISPCLTYNSLLYARRIFTTTCSTYMMPSERLNYRLNPQAMLADGVQYGKEMNFISRYGVLERVTRYYPGDDNVCSKGRKGPTVTREKPGSKPGHLLESSHGLHGVPQPGGHCP